MPRIPVSWSKAFGLLAPVVLLLALNAPFWPFPGRDTHVSPLLNIDGLAIIALFAPRVRLAVALLAIAGLIEFFQVVAATNYFDSVAAFLQSLRFAHTLTIGGFWNTPWLLLGALWAASLFVCWKILSTTRVSRASSMLLLATIVLLDLANGSTDASGFRRDDPLVDVNVASSSAHKFTQAAVASFRIQPLARMPGGEPPLEEAWAARHPGGSILTIVVESMGLPENMQARRWLESQLVTPEVSAKWDASPLASAFHGATTAGELRIICGLKGSYLGVEAGKVETCLPQKLRSAGFQTTAMHGFSARMFNRHIWWKIVGFETVRFAEDFGQDTPLCGSVFRGVCDKHLVDIAVRDAGKPASYVYLLTLNTHLPLTYVDLPPQIRDICARHAIPEGACQMIGQQGMLLRHVATRLAALEAAPWVRIVGDHAPPFVTYENRREFSQALVPEYILVPRAR